MHDHCNKRRALLASCLTAVVVVCPSLLTGCQSHKAAHSGFLRDYSMLRPNPEVDDAFFYQNAAKSLKNYDKFMIDPILVHFAPNAKGTALDPAKLVVLTDYAFEELTRALSERYAVVSASGPGVLHLRAALTDIKKTIPALNIHPATKLSGIGLGGASMEAEALDSQSGERVMAVVDTRLGDRFAIAAGLDSLGHAKQVIRHWTQRFAKRLDEAHGYTKK